MCVSPFAALANTHAVPSQNTTSSGCPANAPVGAFPTIHVAPCVGATGGTSTMSCTAGLRAKPDANPDNFASISGMEYTGTFTQLVPFHTRASPEDGDVINTCDTNADGADTTHRFDGSSHANTSPVVNAPPTARADADTSVKSCNRFAETCHCDFASDHDNV